MAYTLGELAERFDCELRGDATIRVEGIDSLANAGESSLTFFSNPALINELKATQAAAVILREQDVADCPVACIVTKEPYATYARMAGLVTAKPAPDPGVHASAAVSDEATVDPAATIAANAVVDGNAIIGARVVVGAGAYVGEDCVVAADCTIMPNAVLSRAVKLGERCIIHPGAVIGSDGFGNAMSSEGWVKVPQVGNVQIGNDVEIGANTTVDCGAIGDTVIGNGVRIDNLCMIAHNVKIGDHTAMAAMTGIAGSAVIGSRCMFAGQSGTVGHISVCDDVVVTGQTMITKDIREPGTYSAGWAGERTGDWAKNVARFKRLKSLIDRVAKLEKDRQ